MIYKKYYLYKEQVSLDNGVTWEDVTPAVTRPDGDPIASYSTLEECEGITSCTCADFTYSPTAFTVSSAATSVTFSYTGCTKPDLTSAATYNWITIGNHTYDTGSTTGSVIANVSANTSTSRTATLNLSLSGTTCQSLTISQESGETPTACTCDAFAFEGTSEGNNTYRIEIPSNETAVTAATWNTSCDLVPQDFTHTDDSGFQEIVTDGHWIFDNNLIKFTASTNSTNFVREGNMTITYTVDGVSCTKVTHLVQRPSTNFGGRYKLILNNNSVVTGACNSSSAVTSGDVASRYSGTVVSAIIGDCVKEIGYAAFIDCDGLTSVTIGNNVTTINENAFFWCNHLRDIVIPNSVTTIGVSAFYDDEKLSGVTIGTGVTSIGMYAFQGCWELASITIPNNVTTINMYAFHNCKGLNNIIIGNGITSMGEGIFYNDTGLTSVTILATTPPTLGNNAFYNTSSNLVIYVPAASLTDYQTAWSSYASRIQAIP